MESKTTIVEFLRDWHLFIQKKQMPILVSDLERSKSDKIVTMYKSDFITMEQAYDLYLEYKKTK